MGSPCSKERAGIVSPSRYQDGKNESKAKLGKTPPSRFVDASPVSADLLS